MAFLTKLTGADPGMIGPLQRIFLVTDGTLTDILEAALLEPIRLRKLSVETGPAPAADEALELDAGQDVMDRKILLFGETTGRNYVYAESRLALDRLPPGFREGLLDSDKPMGRLWAEGRLELWKEMLGVRRGPMGELAAYFPDAGPGDLLTRRYRVISGGRPIMVITESFPSNYGGAEAV